MFEEPFQFMHLDRAGKTSLIKSLFNVKKIIYIKRLRSR